MPDQPRSRREIRAAERRRSAQPYLIGLLVLVLFGGGGWLGKGLFTGGSAVGAASSVADAGPPTTPGGATRGGATPGGAATPAGDPRAAALAASVASCATAWQLQDAATRSAAVALGEWGAHIEIMSRLQARQISLATAKAQWPATTAQADPHVKGFRANDRALTESQTSCVVPDPDVTGPLASALRACAQSFTRVEGVLTKARLAIAPWEMHLLDQSHFKAGGLTAAAAEGKWRALWQKGVQTLPGYQAAVSAARGATCTIPS